MRYGRAIVVEDPGSLDLEKSHPVVYDREIDLRLLYQDPEKGAEHYVVRYPAGLKAHPHRHSAAHTIVVLEGRMEVNGRVVGPGSYIHFPPSETMHHAPAEGSSCLFIIIFHGPYDVRPVEA